jgi:hypothetical protein
VVGVEFGKFRSESFARRAPVRAEIKQESGLAIERTRGASVIDKASLRD